jgi:hypothetical protein
MGVFADFVAGPHVSEWPDARAIGDGGIYEDAALKDLNAIAEGAVFNDGEGTNAAACANARAAEQLREWLDDRAGRDLNIGIDDAGVWTIDHHSGCD